ncbi:MAG: hypothetical protein ACE5HQ_10595 [Gemmatimonadota bacterium]
MTPTAGSRAPLLLLMALLGLQAVVLSACNELSGDRERDLARLEQWRQEIRGMADPTAATVEECRAIPFGSKPCGGPWEYLIFSVTATDSANLAEQVQAFNAFEAEVNRKYDRVSDCALVARPTTVVRGGVCVAQ